MRSRQPPVHHADFVSVAKGRLPVQEQEEPPRLRLAGPAIGAPSSRLPGPPTTAAAAASLDRRRASVAQTALFSVRRNRATAAAAAAAAGDADAVLLEQVEPYRPEQLRGYTRSVNQAVAMLHVNRYRGYNLADINGQRLAEAAAHTSFLPFASPPASPSVADSDPGSDHDSQHSLDDRAPRVSRTRDFDAIVAATKAATRASLIALIRGEQCTPEESMRLQAAFRAEWAVGSQRLRTCAVCAERHYEMPGALFCELPLDTLGLLEVPPGRVGKIFAWFVRFNSSLSFF